MLGESCKVGVINNFLVKSCEHFWTVKARECCLGSSCQNWQFLLLILSCNRVVFHLMHKMHMQISKYERGDITLIVAIFFIAKVWSHLTKKKILKPIAWNQFILWRELWKWDKMENLLMMRFTKSTCSLWLPKIKMNERQNCIWGGGVRWDLWG